MIGKLAALAALALLGWYLHMKNEIDVLARTIWGEARGEGRDGMEAVATVVMNRVKDARWPNTVSGVCRQPWQFSAWNENDPNREKLLSVGPDDAAFAAALEIAEKAVTGALVDKIGGANHYFADWVDRPSWASAMTETTRKGSHIFFIG